MTILDAFPRVRINFLPTPLTELKRLGRALGGPRIFIKRDDLTGIALGGNKTRKLEFLLGDALSQGCDAVLTCGAMQSNLCRQTAGAAAAVGLECHLALGGGPPDRVDHNLLLDGLLGARIHWCREFSQGETLPAIAQELRDAGRRPYVIPYRAAPPRWGPWGSWRPCWNSATSWRPSPPAASAWWSRPAPAAPRRG